MWQLTARFLGEDLRHWPSIGLNANRECLVRQRFFFHSVFSVSLLGCSLMPKTGSCGLHSPLWSPTTAHCAAGVLRYETANIMDGLAGDGNLMPRATGDKEAADSQRWRFAWISDLGLVPSVFRSSLALSGCVAIHRFFSIMCNVCECIVPTRVSAMDVEQISLHNCG